MEQNNNAIQSVIGSELKAVHERIVGQSQLEGRKKVLEARHEVLSIVKDYALEELKLVAKRENPDYNYDEILINLVLEAIDAIDENNYVISANEGDTPFLRENIEKLVEKSSGKQIEVSENPIDAIGGIFVSNIARNKSMENTLDIRLENASEALQSDIAKKLGVI
jgi:vacuolar-type H+-ATPase subunit E/Vma4